MKTKATLLLAAILAAGSAAAHPGAQQVNPRNPTDSRAFDVMETDQGPPTAVDRLYAKSRHDKPGKRGKRSADTWQDEASGTATMGASGAAGVTGSGGDAPPVQTRDDLRTQPDREVAPDEPRIDR